VLVGGLWQAWFHETSLLCPILAQDPHQLFMAPVPGSFDDAFGPREL